MIKYFIYGVLIASIKQSLSCVIGGEKEGSRKNGRESAKLELNLLVFNGE